MEVLVAEFKIITPLFLSGAEPNQRAELRAASIKGALRYWYRAIDPKYRDHEASIFGGSVVDTGQSSFLLHVSPYLEEQQCWSTNDKEAGLKYLSFPFKMKQNRRFIGDGKLFSLKLKFKKRPKEAEQKKILASLWLLGHLGGLGARSRRGFGTVALTDIGMAKGTPWDALQSLSIPYQSNSYLEWQTKFSRGLSLVRSWFSASPVSDHAVISDTCSYYLGEGEYSSARDAMNIMGEKLMNFRNQRPPDYLKVKEHICYLDNKARSVGASLPNRVSSNKLSVSVQRAAFGLPLTIRYTSLTYINNGKERTPSTTFTLADGNKTYDRSASPLWFRIVEVNHKYYPFYILLDSPLAPPEVMLSDGRGRYPLPDKALLTEFMQSISDVPKEKINAK